jgi:hypothetical protein
LLEDVIATAQRLVKAEKDSSKITPAYIADKVKLAAAMFVSDPPVELDEAKAVSTLIQRFSHRMGKATTLKDDAGHIEWLNAARKKDWHYWRRYRDYQESKLSDVVVDGLDESTERHPGPGSKTRCGPTRGIGAAWSSGTCSRARPATTRA